MLVNLINEVMKHPLRQGSHLGLVVLYSQKNKFEKMMDINDNLIGYNTIRMAFKSILNKRVTIRYAADNEDKEDQVGKNVVIVEVFRKDIKELVKMKIQ